MPFGGLNILRQRGIISSINCRTGLSETGAPDYLSSTSRLARKSNGLIVQWGKKIANKTHIDFPIVFSKCFYFNFIVSRKTATDYGWHYYNNLTPHGVTVLSDIEEGMWIAIGI